MRNLGGVPVSWEESKEEWLLREWAHCSSCWVTHCSSMNTLGRHSAGMNLCQKGSPAPILLNPLCIPWGGGSLSRFIRWGNGGSERLSNWPQATQLEGSRGRSRSQVYLNLKPCSYPVVELPAENPVGWPGRGGRPPGPISAPLTCSSGIKRPSCGTGACRLVTAASTTTQG